MTDRVAYLSEQTTYLAFDALYDLAIKLPMQRYEGAVTTAPVTPSYNTYSDANLPSVSGQFLGGTVFFWYSIVSPASDERKEFLVTDHTGQTITFSPSNDELPVGAAHAIFSGSFPRWLLLQSLSLALQDFGDIPVTRRITTVANQQEYNYVDSTQIMMGNRVVGVEIAGSTTPPYNYVPHYNWHTTHNAMTGLTVCFDNGHIPAGGYYMRMTYMCRHLNLFAHESGGAPSFEVTDALEIAPVINPERLSWQAAVYALRLKVSEAPDEPKFAAALQEAIQRAEQAKAKYPIPRPQRIHYSRWLTGR